jgi:hypothetical protein
MRNLTCALLVQLVERRSPKPDVGGSSPPGRAESPNFKFCPKAPGLLAGSSLNLKLLGRISFWAVQKKHQQILGVTIDRLLHSDRLGLSSGCFGFEI